MRPAPAFAAAAFLWFALGASPTHFWFDSGEISAAASELGVMHPTGVPGLLPFFHLAQAIPLGSLGWRMSLVSAAFAGLLVGVVSELLMRLRVPRGLILICCIWLCCGHTLVRNARVVEIYSFGALLFAFVLARLTQVLDSQVESSGRLASMLLATGCAVWAAWGFGDARLCLALPFVGAWIWALSRWPAWSCWAQPAVALASLPCLLLVLSSARMPIADWGDPDGLMRLWEHLDASSIRAAFSEHMFPSELGVWRRNLDELVVRSLDDLGPALFGLPLLLGYNLLRGRTSEPGPRILCAWMLACQLFYALAINPMGGRDRQTGVVLCVVVVVWTGIELKLLVTRAEWSSTGRLRAQVLAGLGLVLCGVWPAFTVSSGDAEATASWQPHLWTRAALARLPPSARLLTQSDDLAAGTLAARVLESTRPDIVSVPAQHLYRRTPDRVALDEMLSRPWTAAHTADGELGRIENWIHSQENAVWLEYPHTGLFRRLAHGTVSQRGVVSARSVGPEGDDLLRMQGIAASEPDRRRLAQAHSARVRGGLAAAPGPAALRVAEASYRRVLGTLAPNHVPSLVSLGVLLAARGHHGDAESLWRRALELEPWRARPLVELAASLASRREPAAQNEAMELGLRARSLGLRSAKLNNLWRSLCEHDPRACAYVRSPAADR